MRLARPAFLALMWLALAGGVGFAQRMAAHGGETAARLERMLSDQKPAAFQCEVWPAPAQLTYDFRLWSWFRADMPAQQLGPAKPQPFVVVFRVTPEEPAAPAYFWMTYAVPELLAEPSTLKDFEVNVDGGFFLGVGQYKVDWLAVDSTGRVCRKSWNVKAESKVAVKIPPNTVTDSLLDSWKGFPASGVPPRRVAILLHADAVKSRRYRARLSPWDRAVLLDSLKGFLEAAPFTEASLTAFNLDRRQVLFESGGFNPEGYARLAAILGEADNATVDFGALANRPTPGAFLARLTRAAAAGAHPPDAIVFLAPGWRSPVELDFDSRGLRTGLPRVWLIGFMPLSLDSAPRDTVAQFVRKLKGKVLAVQEPASLAAAIRTIGGE